MSIKNLHSILNGKWFIEESYGRSLLPSLNLMLSGNIPEAKKSNKDNYIFSHKQAIALSSKTAKNNDFNEKYVLVLNIKSPIYKYNQECGPRGTKSKINTLDSYVNDSNCKGVVLDIDSGGGQVSGTAEFYDYLSSYNKPVVTYTDGLLCSAAYHIAAGTNHIIANKRADAIGSIGTMVSFIDFSGMYEKKGAKVITEYATKSTEKNKHFEELLKGNPEGYIKHELDPINEEFHANIKASRPNIKEVVLSGGTWNAKDALKNGLIDEIGTLQTAIDKVFELSNKNNNNQNSQNMSKQRPQLQAVLSLGEPLAVTDNGSYLNDEQLTALETHLETHATEVADLNTQLEAAKNNTEVSNKLTAAEQSLTTTEQSVDAMLTQAGLEVKGTLPEKLTALTTKVETYSKKDGEQQTTPATNITPATGANVTLDNAASHNKLAEQLGL